MRSPVVDLLVYNSLSGSSNIRSPETVSFDLDEASICHWLEPLRTVSINRDAFATACSRLLGDTTEASKMLLMCKYLYMHTHVN